MSGPVPFGLPSTMVIHDSQLAVELVELERIRPLVARLERDGDLLASQSGLGENDMILEPLGSLELFVAHLADHLVERAGQPRRDFR
jgi:hypothetical protein